MTTTKKLKIPGPTEWLELSEIPPPKDTWLMVYGNTFKDLSDVASEEYLEQAFCSSRTGMFVGMEGECLSDMYEITHYHVLHGPDGRTRQVEARYMICE